MARGTLGETGIHVAGGPWEEGVEVDAVNYYQKGGPSICHLCIGRLSTGTQPRAVQRRDGVVFTVRCCQNNPVPVGYFQCHFPAKRVGSFGRLRYCAEGARKFFRGIYSTSKSALKFYMVEYFPPLQFCSTWGGGGGLHPLIVTHPITPLLA